MDSGIKEIESWRKGRNFYRNSLFWAEKDLEVPMKEVVTGDAMYLAGYASKKRRPYIYISPKCSAYKEQITERFRDWIVDEVEKDKVTEIESHYLYQIPWTSYRSKAGVIKRLDLTNITKVVEDAIFEAFDPPLDDKIVTLKTERKQGYEGEAMRISVLFNFYGDWQSHG